MQIVLWVAIPSLLDKGSITMVMTVFLIMFLFQYLPKIYHSVCLLRRMQNLSGYIFGTVWWGFALNMIAYFVASHVSVMHLNFFSCNVYLYIAMSLFLSFWIVFVSFSHLSNFFYSQNQNLFYTSTKLLIKNIFLFTPMTQNLMHKHKLIL